MLTQKRGKCRRLWRRLQREHSRDVRGIAKWKSTSFDTHTKRTRRSGYKQRLLHIKSQRQFSAKSEDVSIPRSIDGHCHPNWIAFKLEFSRARLEGFGMLTLFDII